MTTTFSVTRDDIITACLKECGALEAGGTLNTADATDAGFALNILLKGWIRRGLPMWKLKEYLVPTVTSNATYQIGPTAGGPGAVVTDRPLRLYNPFMAQTVNGVRQDIPIASLSQQEYLQYGIKSQPGLPNALWFQSLIPNATITLYPVPNDNLSTVHFWGQVPLSDVNVGTDVLDFPSEMYQALKWQLCAEIAGPYVSSDAKLARIEKKAEQFFEEMIDWGQEQCSIYFGMDRGGHYAD